MQIILDNRRYVSASIVEDVGTTLKRVTKWVERLPIQEAKFADSLARRCSLLAKTSQGLHADLLSLLGDSASGDASGILTKLNEVQYDLNMLARYAAALLIWKTKGAGETSWMSMASVNKEWRRGAQEAAKDKQIREEEKRSRLAADCKSLVKLTQNLHSQLESAIRGVAGAPLSLPLILAEIQEPLSSAAYNAGALAWWARNGKI